jgi:hypothetical protein
MATVRKAECPNCGGPIEFKLGSSAACVCPYCRFSVVRKAQSLEAIGKVAELVPTAAFMAVGDRGTVEGKPFSVGGRLQLDHGSGPWDEWYVELQGGRWGWLAKAQGRFYLTHPLEGAQVPPWESLLPGERIGLAAAGDASWTVSERGGSALVSAEGELPFPAVPQSSGRYADLTADGGLFATIDYGDGSAPPELYVGREIDPSQITVRETALGPRPEERAEAERLRCPQCGGPIDIRAPESTERASCPNCQALLDYSAGALHYLHTLQQRHLEPLIPLGSEGVLRGEQCTVIGYLQRATGGEDGYYRWQEYLLHTERGYRWLVEDGYHFTHLRPVSPGEVEAGTGSSRYRGKKFRAFSSATSTVQTVLGEFYWKVQAGEQAFVEDFVAPPEILSSERTETEINWSLGRYVEAAEVWKAFDLPGSPPAPHGVAPAQPNPIKLRWMMLVAAALIGALVFLGITFTATARDQGIAVPLKLHPATATERKAEDATVYSEPFEIERGPTTLQLELKTNVSNGWVAVASALVDESTNEVREFYMQAEEWHGRSGGERWSEGSPNQTEYLGKVPAGRYVLRFETQWGRQSGQMSGPTPAAEMHVEVGERSPLCFLCSFALLLLPLGAAVVRKTVFEAKRWSQSDMVG